ncbi:unnamed protein product [Phytophthora fragariaefolia]|uniref:Unnamed protein product n=1 Tax=Phytophthora fragariaefolia TaxID=1490495 RepID=A0A9W6X324_9STRA|nr:unnamed protein product [Phytophthora fragariaefolia]
MEDIVGSQSTAAPSPTSRSASTAVSASVGGDGQEAADLLMQMANVASSPPHQQLQLPAQGQQPSQEGQGEQGAVQRQWEGPLLQGGPPTWENLLFQLGQGLKQSLQGATSELWRDVDKPRGGPPVPGDDNADSRAEPCGPSRDGLPPAGWRGGSPPCGPQGNFGQPSLHQPWRGYQVERSGAAPMLMRELWRDGPWNDRGAPPQSGGNNAWQPPRGGWDRRPQHSPRLFDQQQHGAAHPSEPRQVNAVEHNQGMHDASDVSSVEWILDSGSQANVCGDLSLFTTFR